MESLKYSILIQWSDEDECWWASSPEFDHITTFAVTRAEALAEMEGLLLDCIDIFRQEGWELPVPSIVDSPFRPAAIGEVNYHYTAGEMGFTCPCGATVAIDDEPVTCTCGRLYRVRHYLEVKEKG